MAKSILKVSGKIAKNYFLKGSSYFNAEMPEYFQFEKMLSKIDKKIVGKEYKTFYKTNKKPDNFIDTSYSIFQEKNSILQWRQLKLLNPFLYVALVNMVTDKNNWELLKTRYSELTSNGRIKCCSMLDVSVNSKRNNISKWYEDFEQQTIELSLKFDYMAITDISNCYSSIYTHSIAWAINGKNKAKLNRADSTLLGNKIDKLIQAMQYGQTNGIPEGNEMSNFLAEFVLAYIDNELSFSIGNKMVDYRILRYRDDIRIFTKEKELLKDILNKLTIALNSAGLKLNGTKTLITENILYSAIKEEKSYYISNPTPFTGNIQNDICALWALNEKYPNSGIVQRRLHDFNKKYKSKLSKNLRNFSQILAYLVDIVYKAPRLYGIFSSIFTNFKECYIEQYYDSIEGKFDNKPYTEYWEVWKQRIQLGRKMKIKNYKSKLCLFVLNRDIEIWNFDWLNYDIKSCISDSINATKLNKVTKKISSDIFEIFKKYE